MSSDIIRKFRSTSPTSEEGLLFFRKLWQNAVSDHEATRSLLLREFQQCGSPIHSFAILSILHLLPVNLLESGIFPEHFEGLPPGTIDPQQGIRDRIAGYKAILRFCFDRTLTVECDNALSKLNGSVSPGSLVQKLVSKFSSKPRDPNDPFAMLREASRQHGLDPQAITYAVERMSKFHDYEFITVLRALHESNSVAFSYAVFSAIELLPREKLDAALLSSLFVFPAGSEHALPPVTTKLACCSMALMNCFDSRAFVELQGTDVYKELFRRTIRQELG